MNNEEIVQAVLEGDLKTTKWAIPRVVKIFVASTRNDFTEERRCLLENIGPDLQTMYDSTGLEIEIVDMHYGTAFDPLRDSIQYEDQMREIANCQKVSRGCFFICLIGNDWQPAPLPLEITKCLYDNLREILIKLKMDPELLENSYVQREDSVDYVLNHFNIEADMIERATMAIRRAAAILAMRGVVVDEQLLHSAVEHQVYHAIGLDSNHVISVMREFTEDPDKSRMSEDRFLSFKNMLKQKLPPDNLMHLCVRWRTNGINPSCSEHDMYLTIFQEAVMSVLQSRINESIEQKPEVNARNKAIQEIFKECLLHLRLCNHFLEDMPIKWANSPMLAMIRTMTLGATSKHGPIIIKGNYGCGKTSLLATIFRDCAAWFEDQSIIRIARFCGASPRSSYNLELLRVICEQLNLLLQPDGLCIPRDASFDPLYVYNWFQTLLRRSEETGKKLLILIDDLHQLNPLDSDIVAALSWLPTILPPNIHIICTTLYSPEELKMTPLQRERFKTSDLFIELPSIDIEQLESEISLKFERLEEQFGEAAVTKFSSFVTVSEFGLSETEMLQLLMPTDIGMDCVLSLDEGFFNFATYSLIKGAFAPLLMEKFMSGRLLLCWRHKLTYAVVRKRYLSEQERQRNFHSDISRMFFSVFNTEAETQPQEEKKEPEDEQPQQPNASPADSLCYSLRHVEESWIHLLKAGDEYRLKELTLCNFDFLLASVRTISVSYLRSILEHARFYLLDRDVELIYYTVRKASDVLTRDTLQLGAQIISWLRPVMDGSPLINRILLAAIAWCDGYDDPLLFPLNAWLEPPLPLFVKCIACGIPVRKAEPTPSAQHVVVLPMVGDPQLWHAMSHTLVHTFKGHSGSVLCLAVTSDSQYLITGSEDTSTIVWNLKTFQLVLKITEHIAPVLCVTTALKDSRVISGGEDSSIIITFVKTGKALNKLDHHRGPVTAVLYTSVGDVFISGSADKTVCIWDSYTFDLLNTINVESPICMMEMSADSVFLAVACEDNHVYLHTVVTGTLIHPFRGYKTKVLSLCLANDNQRAIVGGSDARIYVFDLRGGSLLTTISAAAHHDRVSCVKITNNDDFCITAGNNHLAYWNFRNVGTNDIGGVTGKVQNKRPHSVPISCIGISFDGTIAVTGATDGLVNVWQLNLNELQATMEGHGGSINCLAFSPNDLFVVSGSDDATLRVWGLTLGCVACTFAGHETPVMRVQVLSDSRRAVSLEKVGNLMIWTADVGVKLFSFCGPSTFLAVTNNMKFIICGNEDECCLEIWPLGAHKEEDRFEVSHSEEITCLALTYDSLHVITGSKDMSLKVWQIQGGKLTQVLVGHTDRVTCVAVAISKKSIVVSGSWDTNLIVWDIETGSDLFMLSGHLGHVTCVKLSGDGTLVVSGSADKRIIVWDAERGAQLCSMQLHLPILGLAISSDVSRVLVHLYENQHLPIICLHNTPATYVKVPVYVAPAIEDLRPSGPKRPNRRLLKKDVSLDSYTWHRKYAHLTTSLMMAAVDERLKRRFSVSASMEEISTIASSKDSSLGSQGIGPEQAALAQSQHFDQLMALWNKKSPPKSRKNLHSLSKQNSRSSRHSTDTEDTISTMAEED